MGQTAINRKQGIAMMSVSAMLAMPEHAQTLWTMRATDARIVSKPNGDDDVSKAIVGRLQRYGLVTVEWSTMSYALTDAGMVAGQADWQAREATRCDACHALVWTSDVGECATGEAHCGQCESDCQACTSYAAWEFNATHTGD